MRLKELEQSLPAGTVYKAMKVCPRPASLVCYLLISSQSNEA